MLAGYDHLGGWVLAGVLVLCAAEAGLDHDQDASSSRPPAVVVPAVLLGWTWLGSVIGNAAFFHRPAVALWGGLLLGLFVAPYLVVVRERWRG